MTTRRAFLRGIAGIIAAPAIVRVASIMPVKAVALVTGWRPEAAAMALQIACARRGVLLRFADNIIDPPLIAEGGKIIGPVTIPDKVVREFVRTVNEAMSNPDVARRYAGG